jgi:soluble cytochrome b562
MSSKAYTKYIDLKKKLEELITEWPDDSPEAEDLRKQMDPLWEQLTTSEKLKVNEKVKKATQ